MTVASGGTAENTILNTGSELVYGTDNNATINGGTQTVEEEGVANGTILNGGNQKVFGTVNSVNIKGGIQNILSGGLSSGSTINGGEMVVASGGTAENTILNTGNELVYGTDNNAVINGGTQTVESDGIANGTTLNSGEQIVESGAAVNNAVINGGTQEVSGTVSGTNIKGGIQSILSGGLSSGSTINGGEMIVASGGTAENTILNTGSELVYGTDNNAVINGGTQTVESGGVANGTILNSGEQIVLSGATVNNAVINGGTQEVSGTVSGTNIKGGIQSILIGGLSSGSTIDGGEMTVASGGTAENTILNTGSELVYGTDNNAVINGGTQTVESGGVANGTTLNGGEQIVLLGATAKNSNLYGGTLSLYGGGKLEGTTNITDAVMNISGSNNISVLNVNNSQINFLRDSGFSTLNIENLNGNGIFNLSSNLADDESDILNITSSSGNFGLIVHDYSYEGNLPSSFKVVSEASVDDDFYLIGGAVDVGAYQYELQHNGNDWVLVRTPNLTDSSVIAKNTYTSISSLFYSMMTPVYNRIRSNRKQVVTENNLWFKGIGHEVKLNYKDDTKSRLQIYGGALGYDKNIWQSGGNSLKIGFFGSYAYSHQDYERQGRGHADTQNLGLYAGLLTDNNWFLDVVGTYFMHDQRVQSYTPAMYEVIGKYNTNGWHGAVFMGRRVDFAKDWFVEPNIGFNYIYVEGADYRTNFNTLVTADDMDYMNAQIGTNIGKAITVAEDTKLNIFGSFNLIHDWDGKSTVQVANYTFNEDISSVRYELGIGMEAIKTDKGNAYVEATTQLGNRVKMPWQINLGLSFAF